MRILMVCRGCHRRYQVSEDKIGRRFRCHRGQVVRVEEPRSHDSGVVRCSSCGASREPDQTHCVFCHSEFVLHERDLHTVCANCLTRVSDQAKFCHSCGDRLEAESVAGEDSVWNCPACGDGFPLKSRRLGKDSISVAECQQCAGLWIGHANCERLMDRAAQAAEHLRGVQANPPKPAGITARPVYRRCVQCGETMARRQYLRRSGVIVDICRDHGIWFDDKELSELLNWVSQGGHHFEEAPEQQIPNPPDDSADEAWPLVQGGVADLMVERALSALLGIPRFP
jgi:Zn-finger nucleic acid-binding protein